MPTPARLSRIPDLELIGDPIGDADLGARALAFAVEARGLNLMEEVAAAHEGAIATLGMTAGACGLVSGPKAASPNPLYFANWPPEWLEYYFAHDLLLFDPTVRWARGSGAPVTWSELSRRLPARDRGREAITASARFGFTEGMAIPTRAGDGSLGLVCIGGPREALSAGEQAYLTVVARAAFEAADRIERQGDIGRAAAGFSAREVECIVLLIQGHSDREISTILGLSEATTRFHLLNARTKSGATSRTHLVALAVAQGYSRLG